MKLLQPYYVYLKMYIPKSQEIKIEIELDIAVSQVVVFKELASIYAKETST